MEKFIQNQMLRMDIKPLNQPLHDEIFRHGRSFPKVGILAPDSRHGVRYVKHIFQSGDVGGLVNKGDALSATLHHTIESAIPKGKGRTGSGFGLLCVNEKLLLKAVFIHSGCCIEVIHPLRRRACHFFGGLFRQVRYLLIGFCQLFSHLAKKDRPQRFCRNLPFILGI